MGKGIAIPWEAIERWMLVNDDFEGAAKTFNTKANSIRVRAKRYNWALPSVIAKRAAELKAIPSQNGAIIEHAAKTLAKRGEAHTEMVFEKANRALKNMKEFPVENARDVELIDRVARRAAGLGNEDDGVKISIISLNEQMDKHQDEDVIEATLIPDNPAPQLHDAGSQDA